MSITTRVILSNSCSSSDDAEKGFPLTALQQAMVAGELSPERWQRDLVQIRCELNEAVNCSVLQQCLNRLIDRHEALRVSLRWDHAGVGRQIVEKECVIPFYVLDLRNIPKPEHATHVDHLLATTWSQTFDVLQPPRIRASLISFTNENHQLLLTYQETELDEHAGKVLIKELFELYDEALANSKGMLSPTVSFRDYLNWLKNLPDTGACHFWSDLLETAPPISPPPLMGTGTCDGSHDYCFGNLNGLLSESTTMRLNQLVSRHGATINTALLAAWSVVVSAHSGEEDSRFAAVFSLRGAEYAGSASAIAMCFNVLPYFIRGVAHLKPNDLLISARRQEMIVRQQGWSLNGNPAARRLMGHPRTQSLVYYDESDIDEFIHRAHPTWAQRRFSLYGRNPYAIAMRGIGGKQLRIQCWYNPNSYSLHAAQCLLDQLICVLELLVAGGDKPISGGELLMDKHRKYLAAWEMGPSQEFRAARLDQLIKEQSQRSPNAIAAIDETGELSYREIDQLSNQLAHVLNKAGLREGATAAVLMNRSSEIVLVLLAILKTGAAFVPIDPSWPVQRIGDVLCQLNTTVIIIDEHHAEKTNGICNVFNDITTVIQLSGSQSPKLPRKIRWLGAGHLEQFQTTEFVSQSTAESVAYIIFTSGSTGMPKGVAVQHRAVCNLIDWARREFHFCCSDRALWVAPVAFDLSVFDIFGILACGGSIRVASQEDLAIPQRLFYILCSEPITFWNSAPQTMERLRGFFGPQNFETQITNSSLRLVFLSGDWIPLTLPGAIRAQFPNSEVIALGGATEATVWSNFFRTEHTMSNWRSIPYGKPIQNSRYYILEQGQRRSGIGVVGELYIAGEVLAKEYAANPDETSERFIADPMHTALCSRMYRTGDSARWWPDGTIELLGRLDNQVKVRGYRIELGDVECALRKHPEIENAVAVTRQNDFGQNQIVAYIITRDNCKVTLNNLSIHTKQLLPEYMVPGVFVSLETLPMTANGKVDRGALANLQTCGIVRERPYIAPHTVQEISLIKIVSDILKIDAIGADDNFFELGGDSLSALSVMFSADQKELHFSLDSLRNKTFAELAVESDSANQPKKYPRNIISREDSVPLLPSQLWLLERQFKRPASYAFSTWLQFDGQINDDAISYAWNTIIKYHEALHIRIHNRNGTICQSAVLIDDRPKVRIVDLRRCSQVDLEKQLQLHAKAIVNSAELFEAVLPQLLCVHAAGGKDFLYLFIPHIITDEHSARIVIDDLTSAYHSTVKGEPISLPPTTMPFSYWISHLVTNFRTISSFDNELDAFLRLPWNDAKPLPRDNYHGINTYSYARDIRTCLTKAETLYLFDAARKLRISIVSLLVTSLAQSLGRWANVEVMPIDITAAGREPIFGSVELYRSTGCFSTIHPALVPCVRNDGVNAIHSSDLRLLEMPARGVFYGMIRYYHSDERVRKYLQLLAQPEIKVNYHGLLPLCDSSSSFQVASVTPMHTLHGMDQRKYLLNLEIMYNSEKLTIVWKYASAIYRRKTIARLANDFLRTLQTVLD